jgi:MbtH protein
MDDPQDTRQYKVVRNDEDQYSIWFADRPVPAGWSEEGTSGLKRECLDHIEQVWTDMRPRSVREQLAGAG